MLLPLQISLHDASLGPTIITTPLVTSSLYLSEEGHKVLQPGAVSGRRVLTYHSYHRQHVTFYCLSAYSNMVLSPTNARYGDIKALPKSPLYLSERFDGLLHVETLLGRRILSSQLQQLLILHSHNVNSNFLLQAYLLTTPMILLLHTKLYHSLKIIIFRLEEISDLLPYIRICDYFLYLLCSNFSSCLLSPIPFCPQPIGIKPYRNSPILLQEGIR